MSGPPVRSLLFTAFLLLIAACGSEPRSHGDFVGSVPDSLRAQLLALATEALRARADVRVHGNIEHTLRDHAQASQLRAAMKRSLELAAHLHRVTVEEGTRYERYEISTSARAACHAGETVRMLVELRYRFTFPQTDIKRGSPPETGGTETHLFYFERAHPLGGPSAPPAWIISYHHEVSLSEHHDREALRALLHPCG